MSHSTRAEVDVILVSYRTRELTLKCLDALASELRTSDARAVVWLVDNASADGTVQAVRQSVPWVRLIENGVNRGFGAANNQAIRQGDAPFVLLLNTDAFLGPGALRRLLDVAYADSRVGAVGPRLLNPDGSKQRSAYEYPSPIRAWCDACGLTYLASRYARRDDLRRWKHDAPRNVPMLIGAALVLRRAALDEVGLFDERFFLYAEETDLCRRLTAAGWVVRLEPEAEATHLGGTSGLAQPLVVFCEFERSQDLFVEKYHGALGLASFRLARLLRAIVRLLVFAAAALLGRDARSRVGPRLRLQCRLLGYGIGVLRHRLAPAVVKDALT